MRKKNKRNQKKENFIKIINLCLPGVFILLNWILFRYIPDNLIFTYFIIATIIIVTLALINNNNFNHTLGVLIFFNLFNLLPSTSCSRGSSTMFPCFYEDIVSFFNIIWSIIYIIVYGIKYLIKNR